MKARIHQQGVNDIRMTVPGRVVEGVCSYYLTVKATGDVESWVSKESLDNTRVSVATSLSQAVVGIHRRVHSPVTE